MLGVLFCILLVSLMWCILSFYWSHFTTRDLPPGPFPLPFVGNMHLIGSSVHVALAKLCANYGDLMTVYLGSERALVVSSSDMAREVLVRQSYVFGGRPLSLPYCAVLLSHGGKDIGFREQMCPRWKKQRKIFHAAIKMFGSGLVPLEEKVCDVIKDLVTDVGSCTGSPKYIAPDLFLCVANVICAITFGSKYRKDDPEFYSLMRNFDVVQQFVAPGNLIDVIPLPRRLLLPSVGKVKSAVHLLDTIVSRKYGEHKARNSEEIRDMTAALQKQHSVDSLDGGKHHDVMEGTVNDVNLTEEEMRCMITDMFFAGIETSTSSSMWGMFLLALHPDIQDQIHEERIRVLGADILPTFSDRHRLPLLWASVTEVLRYGSVVPLLLPHRTTSDASIDGFRIPKDTTILVNAFAIHHDPRIWQDPHTFRPTRFLDADGKYSPPPPFSFYPFSAGKRVCVGEILGKMVVFDIIARMLYHYRVTLLKNGELGANESNAASIRKPKPFKVFVEKHRI